MEENCQGQLPLLHSMNLAGCCLGHGAWWWHCRDCVCYTDALSSHPCAEALLGLPHQPLMGRQQPLALSIDLFDHNQDLLSSLWIFFFFCLPLKVFRWHFFLLFSYFHSSNFLFFCLLIWFIISWLCRLLINSCHILSPFPFYPLL